MLLLKNTDSPLDQESHLCQSHQQGPVEEHQRNIVSTFVSLSKQYRSNKAYLCHLITKNPKKLSVKLGLFIRI